MLSELIEQLNRLPDIRRSAGKRHSIGIVLLVSIMAVISKMFSYPSMGDFVKTNKEELCKLLGVDRLPSYSTIRRVVIAVPVDEFSAILSSWNRPGMESGEVLKWLQIDGKAINGTVTDYGESNQDFINVVSLFFSQEDTVLDSAAFHNKEESEIIVVRDMVKEMEIKGAVLTADAIHAQKKQLRLS